MPPPGVDLPLSIGGGRGYGNFPRRFLAVGEELLPLEGGVIAPGGVLLPPLTPICPPPPRRAGLGQGGAGRGRGGLRHRHRPRLLPQPKPSQVRHAPGAGPAHPREGGHAHGGPRPREGGGPPPTGGGGGGRGGGPTYGKGEHTQTPPLRDAWGRPRPSPRVRPRPSVGHAPEGHTL